MMRYARRYRGLHDFLYSENEDHGATATDGSAELFDGISLYTVRHVPFVLIRDRLSCRGACNLHASKP